MICCRLFAADLLEPIGVDLRKTDQVLAMLPTSIMVTDCKSLYDALARSESQGLGLSEKRTAIEVTATRQQMEATGIICKWVNSDRQLADSLTTPMASTAMQQLCKYGNWKIEFDETFTSAKKVKKFVRAEAFKNNDNRKKGQAKGKPPPKDEARERVQYDNTTTQYFSMD